MPERALLRLVTALSPAFPTGGFAYSHGLERAAHDGWVSDADGLCDWIGTLIEQGSGWNDAVLLAAAHACSEDEVAGLGELAEGLAGSQERHLETMAQGRAFASAAASFHGFDDEAAALPVAVGRFAARAGIPLDDTLLVFLNAFATQQVQAAIRLGVVGQAGGLALQARLEPLLLATAARAAASSLDDLGSATLAAEIAAMNHETQYSRLFRS